MKRVQNNHEVVEREQCEFNHSWLGHLQ